MNYYDEPLVKHFYKQLLHEINDDLHSPYRKHPISVEFEYWRYRIDKNNKVKIKSWLDGKWRRVNKELKRIKNEHN